MSMTLLLLLNNIEVYDESKVSDDEIGTSKFMFDFVYSLEGITESLGGYSENEDFTKEYDIPTYDDLYKQIENNTKQDMEVKLVPEELTYERILINGTTNESDSKNISNNTSIYSKMFLFRPNLIYVNAETRVFSVSPNTLILIPRNSRFSASLSPILYHEDGSVISDAYSYKIDTKTSAVYTGKYHVKIRFDNVKSEFYYYLILFQDCGDNIMIVRNHNSTNEDFSLHNDIVKFSGDEMLSANQLFMSNLYSDGIAYGCVDFPKKKTTVYLEIPENMSISVQFLTTKDLDISYYTRYTENEGSYRKYYSTPKSPKSFYGFSFGANPGYVEIKRLNDNVGAFSFYISKEDGSRKSHPLFHHDHLLYLDENGVI